MKLSDYSAEELAANNFFSASTMIDGRYLKVESATNKLKVYDKNNALIGDKIFTIETLLADDWEIAATKLTITAGKSYRARDGRIWKCVITGFQSYPDYPCVCVIVNDGILAYFSNDGVCQNGRKESKLIAEVI